MKKNMIRLLGALCAVSSLVLAAGCIEETLPKTEATPETIEKSTSSMEYMLNGLFSYFDAQELSAAIKIKENAGSSSRYNTEGWFSRAMYNLDEKYFLSADRKSVV